MYQKKLLFMLFVLAGISHAIGQQRTGAPSDRDKGKGADQNPQITIAEAVRNNRDALNELEAQLKLEDRLDISAAFADGSAVRKVKALAPLVNPPKPGPARRIIKLDPKAYAALATVWRPTNSTALRTPAGNLNISVCWNNPAPENQHGRNLTKAAVEATWEHHGTVRFTGWGKCEENKNKGIKITVEDQRPWSVYGNFADPEAQSMSLNFTFNNLQMAGCKSKADQCTWSIAVHEFGHALSLIHEQDSPDTEKEEWCKKALNMTDIQAPESTLKAKMITDWDRFSVMNYCFDIYSRRVQLSDCDIAAYHKIYGPPKTPPYQPKCKTR